MYWSWLRARADVGVKLKSFNVFQSGKALMRVWQKYSMWPQFNKFASACVEFADPRMINDHILINLHALGLATHNLLDSPSARQLTMQAVKFLALFSDRQCVSAMCCIQFATSSFVLHTAAAKRTTATQTHIDMRFALLGHVVYVHLFMCLCVARALYMT